MSSSEVLTKMKTDFDGYCSKCKAALPNGTARMFHRFSRQILCMDCASPKAGPVKSTTVSKELLERLDRLEKLVGAIAQKLGVEQEEVLDCTPPPQPQRPAPVQCKTIMLRWYDEDFVRTCRLPVDSPLHDRADETGIVHLQEADREFVRAESKRGGMW